MSIEFIKALLKILYYSIDTFIILYALYYIVTGIFAFFNKKKNMIKSFAPKFKFAVIIAARNEEKVIGNLLDSLNKQNYPKELYDTFVLPNNCKDSTEQIARSYKANIIECTTNINSKGEALKYAFNHLNNNYDYDGYIVFDADNIVHPNFITRMNDTMCSGYKVAQGYRDSKNPSDTWISSCYSLFYFVQNYFFNQARMNMGWSSSINGTGFMVAKEVIVKQGFNTITMTEDIEFAAQCALNNQRIVFVKSAITYDEQPLTFRESWKQRKRWSLGTLQCLYYYSPSLFKSWIKNKIPQGFDMALFFLAPIVQVMSFVVILLLMMYSLLGIQVYDTVKYMYDNKVFSIIFGYIISIFISLFVVIIEKKKIKDTIKGVFTLSFFMLTWIPINIICLFKKNYEWEPIKHHRTVEIESIVK